MNSKYRSAILGSGRCSVRSIRHIQTDVYTLKYADFNPSFINNVQPFTLRWCRPHTAHLRDQPRHDHFDAHQSITFLSVIDIRQLHSQNLGKSLAMSNFLLGPIVDCEWLRRFLPPGHQMITDAYHFTHWPRIDYETFLYLKPSKKTCYHGIMFIGWFVICEEPTSE